MLRLEKVRNLGEEMDVGGVVSCRMGVVSFDVNVQIQCFFSRKHFRLLVFLAKYVVRFETQLHFLS